VTQTVENDERSDTMNSHKVLVVAERSADPTTLVAMLARRSRADGLGVTLLVPGTLYGLDWAGDPKASLPEAARYAGRLRAHLSAAGVPVARTLVGDPDPRAAIEDALGGELVHRQPATG
jgi:hypothetical protein